MVVELNRYKGQFIQGKPKRIKPPLDTEPVFFDELITTQSGIYNLGGWIPPKKGAI
jgi:hypothetical protein